MGTELGFERYQHVEKIGVSNTRGILNGKVYLYSKVDGANGSCWLDKYGYVQCGSRNNTLNEEKTNNGFWNYIQENLEKFEKYFEKYPNNRLCGEFLIPHTLKNYRDDAWRKFYVFDVKPSEDENEYLRYEDYVGGLEEFEIEYIPPIVIIDNPTEEQIMFYLDKCTFLVKDGTYGEGVVCKNYEYLNPFGVRKWAKIVRNDFKDRHVKVWGANELTPKSPIEDKIVRATITESLVLKEKAKIVNDVGEWENKLIPRLFGTVWHCLLTEEIADQIKKLKNPVIDFGRLNRLCNDEVKKYIEI